VFVAIVMGIGAVFGAMNTMYALVAARTRATVAPAATRTFARKISRAFLVDVVKAIRIRAKLADSVARVLRESQSDRISGRSN